MSLAMVLANPYGIVMTADRRLTIGPKEITNNVFFLSPSLNHQQKLFLTKSGHGIACVGMITLPDGITVTTIIKEAISAFTDPSVSVFQELEYLKNELMQHMNSKDTVLIGVGIQQKKHEIFKTTLSVNDIENLTDKDGFCIKAEGDTTIANTLIAGQYNTSNCTLFSLQECINYLRFINSTSSKLQYYNGDLQSISEECDVLVVDNDGARWITSQEDLI